jgi:pSer/pThr/pTyr-binding forkhead associated (FHA) protein
MAPDEALHGKMHRPFQRVAIVLEPLTHPELDAIHIDDTLFAIGRTEGPFNGYAPEIVADLSRRHARIFVEEGTAYLADLGSKNGTTVNGKPLHQAIVQLRDGDEIGFGRALSYVARLAAVEAGPAPPARLASLALHPVHAELGLEPIVITRFPFLISKIDDAFARYRDTQPHQVGYLSRRHAHIFLKGGLPYVEDLGSTNGSFIGAIRLDEHAHELQDDDVLAFGGHHFVYRVSLQWEQTAPEPTVTRIAMSGPAASTAASAVSAAAPADADKTTFVAAAGSFLDIFCVERAATQDDEVNAQVAAEGPGAQGGERERRGKFTLLASGMLDAFGGAGGDHERLRGWGQALLGVLLVGGLAIYLLGAPEREVQRLVASGDYADAAVLASQHLARDPDNAEIRARGAEALLKAELPQWIAFLKARRFDRAQATIARMRQLSHSNADLKPLVAEIDWVGRLEQFAAVRGGSDAPVKGPADQAGIKLLLKQWQDDPQAHQRAFASISAYVPAFRDTYAQALSDLRKLALVGGASGIEQ